MTPQYKDIAPVQGRRGRIKVCQFDKEGKFIKEHESITAASEATGVHNASISHALRKTNGYKTAGGYQWKRADEREKK